MLLEGYTGSICHADRQVNSNQLSQRCSKLPQDYTFGRRRFMQAQQATTQYPSAILLTANALVSVDAPTRYSHEQLSKTET